MSPSAQMMRTGFLANSSGAVPQARVGPISNTTVWNMPSGLPGTYFICIQFKHYLWLGIFFAFLRTSSKYGKEFANVLRLNRLLPVLGTGALRSGPGSSTANSGIDFRAHLPPGAPGATGSTCIVEN